MKRIIVFVLFTVAINIEAYPEPRIQVYEIRNANENRDVDNNYSDPDGLRKEEFIETFSNIHKKINTKNLDKLIQILAGNEKIKNRKDIYSNENKINSKGHRKLKKTFDVDRFRKDDIEYFDSKKVNPDYPSELIKYLTRTDEDRRSESSDVEDLTRSAPLIILSVDRHEQPQDVTALGKLLSSPLRTPNDANEDRTAAPRIRRPYDDDY